MMTTGSPTHERNSEAQNVGTDKNLVDGEDQELVDDDLFHDDDSDEDSLLPPPETPEGSLYGFVEDDYSIPTAARGAEDVGVEEAPATVPVILSAGNTEAFSSEQPVDDDDSRMNSIGEIKETSSQLPGPVSVLHTDSEVETHEENAMNRPSTPAAVYYKNKVERRLNEALAKHEFSELGHRADLVSLSQSYQKYRKELRKLIITTKDYVSAHEKVTSTRAKMMDQCVTMSKDTPLFEHVCQQLENNTPPDASQKDNTQSIERLLETEGPLSLVSIEQLNNFYSKTSTEEYGKYVLNFVSEWESVICSRLDQEIKELSILQRKKIHYERKVNGLRKKVNRLEKKGKEVEVKLSEKLARNEEKLSTAWKTHEAKSAQLCFLLEECVHNGYKDLYTFVKNWSRFEINKASRTEVIKMKMKMNLIAMKASDFDAIWGEINQMDSFDK